MKIPMGISYVFLITGALMLIVAMYLGLGTVRFIGQTMKTEGTVVELKYFAPSGGDDPSPTYRPVVRFVTGDGQTVDFTAQMGMASPHYRKGETVTVAYNPADPRNARIDSLLMLWGLELMLGVIGGGFVLFGGGTLLAQGLLSRRAQYLRDHGLAVQTEFVQTLRHPWLVVNNQRPFVVETRWLNPVTAETRIFRSQPVMSDPTAQIRGRRITVYIDRDDARKYHVDLSFLADPEQPA